MSDKWEKFLHYIMEDDSELMELEHVDPEIILEEINNDPELRDVKAPDDLYDKVFAQIREYEEQKRLDALTDEDKELIRLGKIHRKRLSRRKYVVLAAALIAVFAIGTISMGESESILRILSRYLMGGEQVVSDSGSIEPVKYIDEEEVYDEIEETYSITPVKLRYLPGDVEFLEADFYSDIQEINMYYGIGDTSGLIYIIQPNFRETSHATVIEDKKIQDYIMTINETNVLVKEYQIEESSTNRWLVTWIYQDVQYTLNITNMERNEVEKIVNSLKLYE